MRKPFNRYISVATTNHIVAVEVNHAQNAVSQTISRGVECLV